MTESQAYINNRFELPENLGQWRANVRKEFWHKASFADEDV